jgi:hypothetical protein
MEEIFQNKYDYAPLTRVSLNLEPSIKMHCRFMKVEKKRQVQYFILEL